MINIGENPSSNKKGTCEKNRTEVPTKIKNIEKLLKQEEKETM